MAHGMTRIRTIKPSFWSSPDVVSLTRDARLLAIGLISFADDEGRFPAAPAAFGGYVFPFDDIPVVKLRKWLAECEASDFVRTWTVGTARYGVVTNFMKHQRINRPTPSILPAPPADGLF